MDGKGIMRKCPDTLLPISRMGARQQAEAPQKKAVEVQGSGPFDDPGLKQLQPCNCTLSIPHTPRYILRPSPGQLKPQIMWFSRSWSIPLIPSLESHAFSLLFSVFSNRKEVKTTQEE